MISALALYEGKQILLSLSQDRNIKTLNKIAKSNFFLKNIVLQLWKNTRKDLVSL